MSNVSVIRIGGAFLIGGALAFMGDRTAIAAVNNYLLPVWMIIFGVALVRHRYASPDDFSAVDSLTA